MSTSVKEEDLKINAIFNNQDFEANAKESLGTIEDLKKALDFSNTGKSVKSLDDALHGFNLKDVGYDVSDLADAITNKLCSLSYKAVNRLKDAFLDLGENAIRKVTGMFKDLSINQISAGWQKYADKTTAVQTILSATGEDLEYVNAQLEKLNWYTDETSYDFVDMTNNIGKFTSAGVGLEDAVTAMMGISDWAAESGVGIQGASHAMYNLAQALGTGAVKLIDWKSISNANMDTVEFKNTVLETAAALGVLEDLGDGVYRIYGSESEELEDLITATHNFTDSLKDEWFTSEVLIETLRQYGSIWDEMYEKYDPNDYENTSATAQLAAMADRAEELGVKAAKAAQESKTFQDAINSVKDAVSTGWMRSFEIVFGTLNKAKTVWGELGNDLYSIFAEGGELRNLRLQELAINNWEQITSQINAAGLSTSAFEDALIRVARESKVPIDEYLTKYGSLEETLQEGWLTGQKVAKAIRTAMKEGVSGTFDLQTAFQEVDDIMNDIWTLGEAGSFGHGSRRKEALAELGYDAEAFQDLLEKRYYRHEEITEDDIIELYEKSGKAIVESTTMDIEALEALATAANSKGSEFNQLIQDAYKKSTIDKLLIGVGNVLKTIGIIANKGREVYNNIFHGGIFELLIRFADAFERITGLILEAFENGTVLTSVLTVLLTVVKYIGKAISLSIPVLELLLLLVVAIASKVGSVITKISNWAKATIKSDGILKRASDRLVESTKSLYENLKKLLKGELSFKDFGKKVVNGFRGLWTSLNNIAPGLGTVFNDLTTAMSNFVKKTSKWGTSAFANVKGFAKGAWSWSKGIASDFYHNFVDTWNKLPSATNIFIKIGESIIAGITSIAHKVSDKFHEVVAWIKTHITIKKWIEEFLSDTNKSLKEVKDWAIEKYESFGLTDKLETITDGIRSAFEWLDEEVDDIKDFGSRILDKLPAIKEVLDYLMKMFIGFSGSAGFLRITSFIKSLGAGQQLLLGAAAKAVTDTVSHSGEIFASLKGIIENFAGVFKSVSTGIENIADGIAKMYKRKGFKDMAVGTLLIVTAIGGIIGLLYLIKKYPLDVNVEGFGKSLITIGIALGSLLGVMTVLALISRIGGKFTGGMSILGTVLGLMGLMGSIFILMKLIHKINTFEFESETNKAKANMAIMKNAIIAIVMTLGALSIIGLGKPIAAVLAMMLFCNAIVKIMRLIRKINRFDFGGWKPINMIRVISFTALIGAAIAAISKISGGGLHALGAAASVYVMCVAIKKVIKTMQTLNDPENKMPPFKEIKSQLFAVGVAVAGVAALVAITSRLTTGTKPLRTALSMLVMLLAFAVVIRQVKRIGNLDLPEGWGKKLTGVLVTFAEIVGSAILLRKQGIFKSIKAFVAIWLMTKALKQVLNVVKDISKAKINDTNLKWVSGIFAALGVIAVVASLRKVHLIKGAIKAFVAYGLMALSLKAVLWGIQPICDYVKKMKNWETLAKVGTILGALALIPAIMGFAPLHMIKGAIASFIAYGLMTLNLKMVLNGLQPICDYMKDTNWETLGKVGAVIVALGVICGIAGALIGPIALGAVAFFIIGAAISAITWMFTQVLPGFGEAIVSLSTSLNKIFETVPSIKKGIDELNSIENFDSAWEKLKKIFGRANWEGILGNTLADFESLSDLAAGIGDIFEDVSDLKDPIDSINEVSEEDAKSAMGVLKALFRVTNKEAITGKWIADFSQVSTAATGLKEVLDKVPGIKTNLELLASITNADTAIETLKSLFKLENKEAILGNLFDYSALVPVAENLTSLVNKAPEISTGLTTLASIENSDTAFGILKKLFNKTTVQTFISGFFDYTNLNGAADGLVTLLGKAEVIKTGVDKINEISDADVTSATTKIGNLVAMANEMADDGFLGLGTSATENLEEVSTTLETIGTAFSSFADGFGKINVGDYSTFLVDVNALAAVAWNSIKTGIDDLASAIKGLNENSFKGAASDVIEYKSAIEELTNVADTFADASFEITNTMYNLGDEMVSYLCDGIRNNTGRARTAGNTLSTAAYNGANGYYNAFYNIGLNMATGLANGLKSPKAINLVNEAAETIAETAYSRTKNTAQVASPSKVFAKLGEFMAIGLAKGMTDETDTVSDAAYAMTEKAMRFAIEASNAISQILEDEDEPVITPVLDLSNVANGMNRLDTMMPKTTRTVNLTSQVAVSHAKLQNERIRTVIDGPQTNASVGGASIVSAGTNVNVKFTGSLSRLASILHPEIEIENNRIGPSYVKG